VKTLEHPLVENYLRRLEAAARPLPRHERDELVTEIRGHIAAALASDASEADVRNVLDQLGDPVDIAVAAGPAAAPGGTKRGAREVLALLLLVSGMPPILGWLGGFFLLLWSPLWTARQKALGALVWPGGWFTLMWIAATPTTTQLCSGAVAIREGAPPGVVSSSCTGTAGVGPWFWPVAIVLIAAPILVAAYLWRAAGRQQADV
jgi:hypothetical protein